MKKEVGKISTLTLFYLDPEVVFHTNDVTLNGSIAFSCLFVALKENILSNIRTHLNVPVLLFLTTLACSASHAGRCRTNILVKWMLGERSNGNMYKNNGSCCPTMFVRLAGPLFFAHGTTGVILSMSLRSEEKLTDKMQNKRLITVINVVMKC
jgi:hypothetical protein